MKNSILCFLLFLFFTGVSAQQTSRIIINPQSRHNPDYQWFSEARFGMFIHFSLASMFGEDLGYQAQYKVPYKQYEANVKKFNPSRFSAKAWVDVAESAGCKYIIFTAKHSEGFCNWDTKTTDFKITNTPFGRDILKELSEECRRRGMRLGVYINPSEWHSRYKPSLPGNWGDRDWKRDDDEPDWEKHTQYMEAQLTEILTNYGSISAIWFDCTNHQEHHFQGERLYKLIKRLQPACIVNERAKYGDFLTPEWDVNENLNSEVYLIEQCTSVVENGWGYNKNARHRSLADCVDFLVRTAGCGSNLLLNVGPQPDGVIPEAQAERMRSIGEWLKINGEAIYGTTDVHLAGATDNIRITRSGNDLFIILRQWPLAEHFNIPGIHTDPVSARLLGGGLLRIRRIGDMLDVDGLPASPADNSAKVVQLHFDKVPVLEAPRRSVRIEHVIPVVHVGRTSLPVAQALMEGITVKGWQHEVIRLIPPDAAFEQKSGDLPYNSDQPFDMSRKAMPQVSAIINWRWEEESTVWYVETDRPVSVRVRACVRCPKIVAGSSYVVRAAGQKVEAKIQGNGPLENRVQMDWYKGYWRLPFVWEEVGLINLPAGRTRIEMQPTNIIWSCNFADVMGLELIPVEMNTQK